MADNLVTQLEAADLLSCSLSTIQRLRQSKQLRTVNIGRSVRIPIEDIEWLNRQGLSCTRAAGTSSMLKMEDLKEHRFGR